MGKPCAGNVKVAPGRIVGNRYRWRLKSSLAPRLDLTTLLKHPTSLMPGLVKLRKFGSTNQKSSSSGHQNATPLAASK